MIRQFHKDISHSCLIFFMTLCDVLLSLFLNVVAMFIMHWFDMLALTVSGFSPGLHTKHVHDLRVFLLVCGLRRVKDPLYLADDFSGKSKSFSFE